MGVKLDFTKKEILDVKNTSFELFYNEFENVLDDENIQLNETLKKLVEDLSLCQYGIGLDLADYLKNKNDFEQFSYLIFQTLNKIKKNNIFSEQTLNVFDSFYRKLKCFENLNN